jgi:hypothetical protein
MGDAFDESKMTPLVPAASDAWTRACTIVMASGEVVVQGHGMSPMQVNYINPNDDPSRKK